MQFWLVVWLMMSANVTNSWLLFSFFIFSSSFERFIWPVDKSKRFVIGVFLFIFSYRNRLFSKHLNNWTKSHMLLSNFSYFKKVNFSFILFLLYVLLIWVWIERFVIEKHSIQYFIFSFTKFIYMKTIINNGIYFHFIVAYHSVNFLPFYCIFCLMIKKKFVYEHRMMFSFFSIAWFFLFLIIIQNNEFNFIQNFHLFTKSNVQWTQFRSISCSNWAKAFWLVHIQSQNLRDWIRL